MSGISNPPPGPSFGDRMGQAFVNLVRLLGRVLLILALVVLLGVGFFYGIPWLYDHYIQPVEENTARLEDFQNDQAQNNQQFTQQVGEMQTRLETLEARSTLDARTVADLQACLEGVQSDLQKQIVENTTDITTTLTRLEQVGSSLANLGQEINELSATAQGQKTDIQDLTEKISQEDPAIAALRRELYIVKAMELVTRSRLLLGQNNYGLARQDVQAARAVLAELESRVLDYQRATLSAMIARLDLVLEDLPGSPVIASDDLEIAWQLLVKGLPGEPPLPTASPAASTPTTTPTVTITPTVTTPATLTITVTTTPRGAETSTPYP